MGTLYVLPPWLQWWGSEHGIPQNEQAETLSPPKKKEKQRLVPKLLLPHKILLELSVTSETYRPEKADRGQP